jgi:hypothetical protein
VLDIATTNPDNFDFSVARLTDEHLIPEAYADESSPYVFLQDFEEDGSPVLGFGHDGVLRLKFPEIDSHSFPGPSDVVSGARGDILIVGPIGNGVTVEEIVG